MAKIQTELKEQAYLRGVEECANYAVKELEEIMGDHMVLELGQPEGGKCEAVLTIPDPVAFHNALTKLESRLENVIDALRDKRTERFSAFVGSLRIHDEKLECKDEIEADRPATGEL